MTNTQTATTAQNAHQQESPKHGDSAGNILEGLINLSYNVAKKWVGWHLIIEASVYAAGIAAVFIPTLPLEYPAVGLILVLITALLSAKVEKYKGIAETLKRQHEYWQGLGISPSKGQLADLRVSLSGGLSPKLESLLREGITFASGKPLGADRLLENLSESAWFSKDLAGWCSDRLREIFVCSVLLAVVVLLSIASSVHAGQVGSGIAKCVSSTLAFLMSVGVLKSCQAFGRFSREAGDIEAEAQRLLSAGNVDRLDVQRLLSAYQLARASAPLIPTWVWTIRRDKLNQNWKDLKRPTQTSM